MMMQAVPMGFFVYICPVGWLGHDESTPVCRALLGLPVYACHAASVAAPHSMSSEERIDAGMRS